MQEDIVYTAVQNVRISREGTDEDSTRKSGETGNIASATGLFEHITLLEGELPSAQVTDGVLEAVISEEAAKNLNCALGTTYGLTVNFSGGSTTWNLVTKVHI